MDANFLKFTFVGLTNNNNFLFLGLCKILEANLYFPCSDKFTSKVWKSGAIHWVR